MTGNKLKSRYRLINRAKSVLKKKKRRDEDKRKMLANIGQRLDPLRHVIRASLPGFTFPRPFEFSSLSIIHFTQLRH